MNMATVREDGKREVELLRNGDAEAWQRVRERSVRLEMGRFRHSNMVRLWHLSEDELFGELYEDMVVKGKLSFYQGDGNLYGWLGKYVVGYIYRANPDRRREMPVKSVVPYADVVHDDTVVNGEERRLVDQCLGRMWLKNPMRAYVHYMKLGEGLSSREILRFFGLSSEANVDQIFSRAVKSMRKLRREHV